MRYKVQKAFISANERWAGEKSARDEENQIVTSNDERYIDDVCAWNLAFTMRTREIAKEIICWMF